MISYIDHGAMVLLRKSSMHRLMDITSGAGRIRRGKHISTKAASSNVKPAKPFVASAEGAEPDVGVLRSSLTLSFLNRQF